MIAPRPGIKFFSKYMIKILPAKTKDLGVVYGFISALEGINFNMTAFRKIYISNLESKDVIYLIAWERDPLGFISCHVQDLLHHCARVAEIQEMFVAPAHRNEGIGKALLKELKKILMRKNIAQLEVV